MDFHHNYSDSTPKRQVYTNSYVYMAVHVQTGPFSFLFGSRLYMRAKGIRQINRKRSREQCLHYRSKCALALSILLEEVASACLPNVPGFFYRRGKVKLLHRPPEPGG